MAGTRRRNLHFFPMAVCILCPLTFAITLAVALVEKHITGAFPYISYTGVMAPESCIFSQLLNASALLLAFCVYIRHLQVAKFTNFKAIILLMPRTNLIASIIGYLSCFGMCIVANFQVTSVTIVHYVGAMLCFWGGTIYFIFQTVFSYHMGKITGSRFLFWVRVILCFFTFLFNISAVAPGLMYNEKKYREHLYWDFHSWDFLMHFISAASEWLLAITQSVLVLTFLPEFRDLAIYAPVLKIEGIND